MILSKEICFHIVLYFCDNFYIMNFAFQRKVALRGFHIYKNTTWINVNIGQKISVQLETNDDSKKIDLLCHKNHGRIGRIDGSVLSTPYHPSPIPSGGLEIPLMMTFRKLYQKMKDFMTKLYCYGHKPVTENAESDSDSDEFHIQRN